MTHSQSVTLSGSPRADLHRHTKGTGNDTLGMKRQVKSRTICKFACAMDFTESAISRLVSQQDSARLFAEGRARLPVTRSPNSSSFFPPAFVNYFIRFWYHRISLFKFECAPPRKRCISPRDGRVT